MHSLPFPKSVYHPSFVYTGDGPDIFYCAGPRFDWIEEVIYDAVGGDGLHFIPVFLVFEGDGDCCCFVEEAAGVRDNFSADPKYHVL